MITQLKTQTGLLTLLYKIIKTSGYSNTVGSFNTGKDQVILTGRAKSVFGNKTGFNSTKGSNNLFIGNNAGFVIKILKITFLG